MASSAARSGEMAAVIGLLSVVFGVPGTEPSTSHIQEIHTYC